MKQLTLITLILLSLNLSCQDISKTQEIVDNIDQSAFIGIQVTDLSTNEITFKHNNKKLFTPASTIKLLSTGAVLDSLGEDYTYKTSILYSGTIENGVLLGNLIIKGAGDPTFFSKYFDSNTSKAIFNNLLKHLKGKNINSIKGDIVLDLSLYDSIQVIKEWLYGDVSNYYAALPRAISFSDNTYQLSFNSNEPNELTSIHSISTKENIQFTNLVIGKNSTRDNAYIIGDPLSLKKQLIGSIPKQRTGFTIKGASVNPHEVFANSLKTFLNQNGISTSSRVKYSYKSIQAEHELFTHFSIPISSIAAVTNYKSINLFAEHLCALLQPNKVNVSNNGYYLKKYWSKSLSFYPKQMFFDGSGLSPMTKISPYQFTKILKTLNNNNAFYNSIPIVGLSGTVKSLLDASILKGEFRLKSGTMTSVKCYAGYYTKENKTYSIVLMINNYPNSNTLLIKNVRELLLSLDRTL